MSGVSVTYVGLRSRQLSFGSDDTRVVGVVEGDQQRPLPPPDPRWAQIPTWAKGGPSEWGYEGAVPLQIAESILLHHLGFQPAGIVALAFSREVVARLPDDFELEARRVDEWISEHLVSGCLPPEQNGRLLSRSATESRAAGSARRRRSLQAEGV